jgi:hypothetical protein
MMFSPITALTVGTLALAASGALYVAQAPADEAALAPAANEIDPAPVFFTGKLSEPPMCDVDVPDPTTSVLSGVIQQRDQVYACFQWETTEPRLNGESVVVWNTDRWTGNSDRLGGRIQSGRELITTESGAWEGTLTHLQVEDGLTLESGWYVGSGAHDGLVAYVVLQDNGDELWGYISGDPPPMPEEVPDLLSDAA